MGHNSCLNILLLVSDKVCIYPFMYAERYILPSIYGHYKEKSKEFSRIQFEFAEKLFSSYKLEQF